MFIATVVQSLIPHQRLHLKISSHENNSYSFKIAVIRLPVKSALASSSEKHRTVKEPILIMLFLIVFLACSKRKRGDTFNAPIVEFARFMSLFQCPIN